ncbi:MAG: translation initiation factor IF-2 [Bacteroidia bacterium]|nr:translation initiation factor IF-2 [Bacteroidia bacterium]
MPEEKKVYRFFKVAKELNVGISTLADHLVAKGYDVSSSPNEKLDEGMYNILLQDFASEKMLKEKAEQIREKKNETLNVIEETPNEEEDILSAEQLRSDLLFGGPKKSEAPEKEETTSKPIIPNLEKSLFSTANKTVAPKEVEKPETPQESQPAEKETGGLKILGKIDLDVFNKNKNKRPAEKTPVTSQEPKREEKKAEPEIPEKKEVSQPVAEAKTTTEAPVAKVEPKTPVEPEKTEVVKDDVIRAADSVPRLSGLTVLGKIELPGDKKKVTVKKDGGDEGEDGDKTKRKRRRKRKKPAAVDPKTTPVKKAESGAGSGPGKKGVDLSKKRKEDLSEDEIQKQIRQTLADINKKAGRTGQRRRRAKRDEDAQRRDREAQRAADEAMVLEVTEFITANELAGLLDVQVNEIITKCMELGMFVSINQRLEADVIVLLAEEYGYEVKWVSITETEMDDELEEEEEDTDSRPPIVTVMGHVDHGKTSLLDYVRKANVIAGEAGGITQHIGAYAVNLENEKKITFLDTPGHEAFTAMRARGAKVTDIVIIVIAADDAVMPQTKEAITHAQAAGAPMVFAINKIDKPNANPDKIREQLSQMNILTEDWGGKYQSQEISAKSGKGVEELLEKVLLEAELLELKANDKKVARGTVVEARLDKGRGVVSTFLVQNGTLKMGDTLVAGIHFCKVKAMHDERGNKIREAGPSMPVQVLGLTGVPQAGDNFIVYESEKKAKEISNKRQELYRQQALRQKKHITLEVLARRKALGDFQQLNVIIKGDVDGSIEALADSLLKLSTEELEVNIILKGVGQISESDVNLASASDAIIVGFQVRPSAQARNLAESEGIDIRLYSIIYDVINDVKDAMEGMLSPEMKEEINGTIEIREVFKITKVGTVGGSYVTSGKINRNDPVRLIRDGIVIYDGKLASIKRFKDDVKDVVQGYECGIQIDKYNDLKIGDIVESYRVVEEKRTLN